MRAICRCAQHSIVPGTVVALSVLPGMLSPRQLPDDTDRDSCLMPINFDTAFGVHGDALAAGSRRAKVLSANIANADTPGYQARDIDFSASLRAAQDTIAVNTTSAAHIGPSAKPGGQLLYRTPLQPSVDGNTVDAHVEKSEFMRNSVLYSANLTFLGARINGLLNAIRGGQ